MKMLRDPGGNKAAVKASFLEAALESNLKGARPMRQREVPVSIPTFPEGRKCVLLP